MFNEQLDRTTGVVRFADTPTPSSRALPGSHIDTIRMKSGQTFAAKMFIDASYEGDLLAAAQVPYRVGRESNGEYNESLAGVYIDEGLTNEVDPYRTPGDPKSGVFPGISVTDPGPNGTGDQRIEQYNLRLCVTNIVGNRIPFTRPINYSRANYELLRRRLLLHPTMPITEVIKIQPLPAGKADINANGSFSTDMAGDDSTRWPEATDDERATIMQHYRDYTQGLFWFLVNDPGVPLPIRRQAAQWGLAADEFSDTEHWPWQLYVREARRMIGAYVITQHDCEGEVVAPDPVALGSYSMDSHKVTLYLDSAGRLTTEGFVDHSANPYPISYRAIIPRTADGENLLVPICLSATHVAFNSIRMEPVYMMLGQSAATAACLAIDQQTSVQRLSYRILSRQLRADGQLLTWPVPPPRPAAETSDEPDTDSEPPPVRPRSRSIFR
jgi:hypothetical protein